MLPTTYAAPCLAHVPMAPTASRKPRPRVGPAIIIDTSAVAKLTQRVLDGAGEFAFQVVADCPTDEPRSLRVVSSLLKVADGEDRMLSCRPPILSSMQNVLGRGHECGGSSSVG